MLLILSSRLFVLCLFLCVGFACSDEFSTQMGKGTPRWRYVKNEKDREEIVFFQKLYEQSLKQLTPQAKESKIPPVVHFIWIGPKNFPLESIQNVRSWMAQHPDWTFKFWTDRFRPPPCSGMQVHLVQNFPFAHLKDKYDAAENWGQKSDLLRYEILYREGGLYVDHDASCLQPFDLFHKSYDFFGGLETPHWSIDGFHITAGIGLIGSKARHPVILGAIESVKKNWDRAFQKYASYGENREKKIVMNTTYIALTHALHRHLNQEGNVDAVFPPVYFFATDGLPAIYASHGYTNAWDDRQEKITPYQRELIQAMTLLKRRYFWTFTLLGASLLSLVSTALLLRRVWR